MDYGMCIMEVITLISEKVQALVGRLRAAEVKTREGSFASYRRIITSGDTLKVADERALIDAMSVLSRGIDDVEADGELLASIAECKALLGKQTPASLQAKLVQIDEESAQLAHELRAAIEDNKVKPVPTQRKRVNEVAIRGEFSDKLKAVRVKQRETQAKLATASDIEVKLDKLRREAVRRFGVAVDAVG
jgi:hypothetical protein